MACNLGCMKTWKITYYPRVLNGGIMGVVFVEADTHQWAMYTFQQLYAGQYTTIYKCEELFKSQAGTTLPYTPGANRPFHTCTQ